MKKRNVAFACCAGVLALLVSCASTDEAAEAEGFKTVEHADVMPIENNGKLDLYYLYETTHNIQAYHPIHKFSTDNFYKYEDEGLAVPTGIATEPDVAIGTGSFYKAKDGLFHCFYTGHNDAFAAQGKPKECILHAVSRDAITWEKRKDDGKNARMKFSTRRKDTQTTTSAILSFCGAMTKTATGFWSQHERKQTAISFSAGTV